jgi:hypothetical protein
MILDVIGLALPIAGLFSKAAKFALIGGKFLQGAQKIQEQNKA